ncbi:MAG: lysophospholipase L1-like esterase [Granulosicoccus sp.]|jgi:lysophospholipase L1-like esterase
MNRSYFLNIIKNIPAFPVMYVQSKILKRNIHDLPEAVEPHGSVNVAGSTPFQLVTLGESTLAGVGVETHSEGFTGTLATHLASAIGRTINWSVYAKSGYTAKKVHLEILPLVKETKIDLIVVGLGGNDAFEFTTPYQWGKNIRKLIEEIRAKHGSVPIAFANMPPVREFPAFSSLMQNAIGNQVDYLGLTLAAVTKDMDNVFFDTAQLDFSSWVEDNNLDLGPSDFFSDGVHPSVLTYQKWAENYAAFLMEEALIKHQPITGNES